MVLDGYAWRRGKIGRLQSRSWLSYLHPPPRLPQDIHNEEGRRGVREDGDPAIGGLYRLVSGLPTPLRAQFHWPCPLGGATSS